MFGKIYKFLFRNQSSNHHNFSESTIWKKYKRPEEILLGKIKDKDSDPYKLAEVDLICEKIMSNINTIYEKGISSIDRANELLKKIEKHEADLERMEDLLKEMEKAEKILNSESAFKID